jgi:hypothetical protein
VQQRLFPTQVTLDPDEVERVNRVRLALLLHKTPAEIDALPEADYNDLMQVIWADSQK